MYTSGTPTDQRAGIRPISFVLDNDGAIGAPVTLKIRPEDLTRNEPSRATVHQTLGRETSGWVDNFGAGLPSATIAGHTGWRPGFGAADDGVKAFEKLNQLVVHNYHDAKQAAINAGRDPAGVKLLFIDMLDSFAWSVVPSQFVLRRSRSRPLLMQYNIVLQAVSTSIDSQYAIGPNFGSLTTGIAALDRVISALLGFAKDIQGWVASAVSTINGFVAPIAATVRNFAILSTAIFTAVHTSVSAVNNGIRAVSNSAIGIARDVAIVGANVFRTLASIDSIPGVIKASLGRVSAAYNEVLCILSNSLRQRKTYENYEGLYGASNCSSTTGGRGESIYLSENAFGLMQPERSMIELSTPAMASVASLSRTDPVLAPMPLAEMERHVALIVGGTRVSP